MENRAHAFWAGLFTVVLGIVVVGVLLWLRRDTTEHVPYEIVTRGSVGGLSQDAAVRYRGIAVGRVVDIHFDKQVPGQIVIRIAVDRQAPITASTYASLSFQGVTGRSFVQLDDNGADPRPLLSDDAHVARLPLKSGLIEQLQQRGVALLDQAQVIANEMQAMLGADSRHQLLATAASLQQAASGVAALSRNLEPVARALPTTMKHLDQALASTSRLANSLDDPRGPLLRNVERMGAAADRASTAVGNLDRTVADVAARVSYDTLPRVDALSDDVRTAARSIERASDSFQSNPRGLIFGAPAAPAGPGEAGFVWPQAPGAR
ncbi:MAG: MlaD family protein [Janthinobacterium lividum]